MAKFLNTSGTNYHLEELIKGARDRLILISPFLKLNDRMKELLADKDRLKIDVRIVYGKSELAPAEIDWLKGLTFVRTSFCKNLHAKCYLSEEACIVTSLNLYEFSMVNNNEMGVLIDRGQDADLYRDVYEEAQRIIRISEEVRISLERVEPTRESTRPTDAEPINASAHASNATASVSAATEYNKLTSAKLAARLGVSTKELLDRFAAAGFLELKNDRHYVAPAGKSAGVEWRPGQGGGYLLWPAGLTLPGQ
ncbi:MAG: phospholipase D family protein [Rhizobacter sp.]|nr:phospholipase D family protein [Rhizobacter sp.]